MPSIFSPFFSVIIPTFNRKVSVEVALRSILEQSFKKFELIIIDDGSTDQTKEMIKTYKDRRIYYLYQENHGVAHARNRGLEQARGQFVAFLDSDDRWVPQKLERVFEYIQEYPDIKVFHTEEKWYKAGKIHNPKKKHQKPTGFVYTEAIRLCSISISTAAIHRDVFSSIGNFDEELLACEDYDFWLRATHKYEIKLIEEYLTLKDGGRPDQLSAQWGLDRYRIKALAKMLDSGRLNDKEYEATRQELIKRADVFINGAQKRGRLSEANLYKKLIQQYEDRKLNIIVQ